MRVRDTLKQYNDNQSAAFMPFVMAGDPDMQATTQLLFGLQEMGADVVELAIPFSDPIADGPTNIRAADRSLRNGVSVDHVLDCLAQARRNGFMLPVMLFTYLNPVYCYGLSRFAERAKASGVDSVLIVDFPVEEFSEVKSVFVDNGLGVVLLVSQNTSLERIQKTIQFNPEVIYYVTRKGITGVGHDFDSLVGVTHEKVALLKQATEIPICVGFGISTPEHVGFMAKVAEGVVVASALVREFEGKERDESIRSYLALAAEMKKGCLYENNI